MAEDFHIQIKPEDLTSLIQSDEKIALKASNIALQRMVKERAEKIGALNKELNSMKGANESDGAEGDLKHTEEVASGSHTRN